MLSMVRSVCADVRLCERVRHLQRIRSVGKCLYHDNACLRVSNTGLHVCILHHTIVMPMFYSIPVSTLSNAHLGV